MHKSLTTPVRRGVRGGRGADGEGAGTMFSWLWRWRRRRAHAPLRHPQFIVYTRRGCHLCEHAWGQLEAARRRHGFSLAAVDVDTDPELAGRYGGQVPVVVLDGKVRFRGCVNPVLLARLLRAEASRRRGGAGEGSLA